MRRSLVRQNILMMLVRTYYSRLPVSLLVRLIYLLLAQLKFISLIAMMLALIL
jgi:hypothetical protein